MATPKVHLIDDDSDLCRSVTRLLRSHEYDVEIHRSPSQFIFDIESGPQCVLLDLGFSDIGDWEVRELLARTDQRPPVVIMSARADIQTSVSAMKAGAVDFLPKPFEDHHLLAAVRFGISLSELAMHRRENIRKDEMAFISLTPREQQVCLRIAQGLLNKQVGYELGTTEKTVKVQRAHVMQKLGASSLPDVVRLVERLRIAGFSFQRTA